MTPPAVRDGPHARIRPARRALIARLSGAHPAAAVHIEVDQLMPARTRFLVEVDHRRREALVAGLCAPARRTAPRLIGVARYDTVSPASSRWRLWSRTSGRATASACGSCPAS